MPPDSVLCREPKRSGDDPHIGQIGCNCSYPTVVLSNVYFLIAVSQPDIYILIVILQRDIRTPENMKDEKLVLMTSLRGFVSVAAEQIIMNRNATFPLSDYSCIHVAFTT